MAHTTYEVHSWTCSIPNCEEQLTGYGADHAREMGWHNETIFGQEFDLCPSCLEDLEVFLGVCAKPGTELVNDND